VSDGVKEIRFFLTIIFLLSGFGCGFAQEAKEDRTDYTLYRLKASGLLSADDRTPFWMASNQHGVVPLEANNGSVQAGVFHAQPLGSGWAWQAGLDMVAVTPRYRATYVQQLYAAVSWRPIHFSIGSREGIHYNASLLDARLSSGDMAVSANARPMPEMNLYVPDFVTVPGTGGWLQGKGNFAVGRSFDRDYLKTHIRPDRYYNEDILWHHKSFYLRLKDTKQAFPLSATLGIRHVVQWGGVSTNPAAKVRVQPHSFKDLLRIVFGQSGDEQATLSDQVNVLGNHLGTYDFFFTYDKKDFAVSAYYQHYFDDASGMEFVNGTDGLWGIQADFPTFAYCRRVVVEHLVTLDQSGPFHFIQFDHDKYPGYGGGGDDYYNNGEYTTGNSCFSRSLGSPFLLSPEYNADGSPGFLHTRVRAWHLGVEGEPTKALSYRILLSALESFGTPYLPALKKLTTASVCVDMSYHFRHAWTCSVSLATDRGSLLGNRVGFGVSITKKGLIR
jgi:hypothetical protein